MAMDKILLVDDDIEINMINAQYLRKQHYEVCMATNRVQAMKHLIKGDIDCIVLDVMLHKEDGFALCREIKKLMDTPIIFLTSLNNERDMELGFHSGGIDYMYKPYSLKELQLRIQTRIHQSRKETSSEQLSFPPLYIYVEERLVHIEEKAIQLTASEFDVLLLLAKSPQKIFSIAQIYQIIWKLPDIENAQTVQVHIANLRKKMEHVYPTHHFIQTVWGKGYKFCMVESNQGETT